MLSNSQYDFFTSHKVVVELLTSNKGPARVGLKIQSLKKNEDSIIQVKKIISDMYKRSFAQDVQLIPEKKSIDPQRLESFFVFL